MPITAKLSKSSIDDGRCRPMTPVNRIVVTVLLAATAACRAEGPRGRGAMIVAQLAEVGVRVTVAERSWDDLNARRSGGQVSFLPTFDSLVERSGHGHGGRRFGRLLA